LEPHCRHTAIVGEATFHCALRRRVRERDIFFLGTAMANLVSGSVSGVEKVLEGRKWRLDRPSASGGGRIQVAFGIPDKSLAFRLAPRQQRQGEQRLIAQDRLEIEIFAHNMVFVVIVIARLDHLCDLDPQVLFGLRKTAGTGVNRCHADGATYQQPSRRGDDVEVGLQRRLRQDAGHLDSPIDGSDDAMGPYLARVVEQVRNVQVER
jgi:hypothetical protein